MRFSRYWRRTAGGCRALSHQYVNLRAGPGTDFPVILTVQAQAPISIRGCLGDYTWCDVVFGYDRGWMSPSISQEFTKATTIRFATTRPGSAIRSLISTSTSIGTYITGTGPFTKTVHSAGPRPEGWVPVNVDRQWRPYTYGRWGLHRSLRMEVELRQAVWLGHLPLRPMGFLKPGWLVLGAGQPLGSGLGVMAVL